MQMFADLGPYFLSIDLANLDPNPNQVLSLDVQNLPTFGSLATSSSSGMIIWDFSPSGSDIGTIDTFDLTLDDGFDISICSAQIEVF